MVKVVQERGRTVVLPHGELWMATAPSLTACCEDLVAAGVQDIVVDLGEVSLLCSAGVDALLHCEELARTGGGSLAIRNAQGLVRRVVELTAVSRYLTPDGAFS